MTDTLWLDIETRSRVDLKKYGVYPYAQCPDFRILMASWSTDGETVTNYTHPDAIMEIPGLWDPDVRKVAHNAQFERIAFSRVARDASDDHDRSWYLPPEQWDDTQSIASELGYPKSLEKLARALGADPKDEAGTRLINLFCKPNRKGGWNDLTSHPMEWLEFIAYCDQDVFTLIDVERRLAEQGGWPTEMERQVFFADQAINDRGIAIDLDLARKAVGVGESNQIDQKARVTEITEATGMPVENPGSVQQVGAWLDHMGQGLPNLRAETVERALVYDLPDPVREVLELRQELALAAPAKFATALAAQVDGRLHGTLKFFGAHTGRWAGRGTQVQNLPRLAFETEEETEAAILDLLLDLGASAETLKKLVRAMFLHRTGGTVVDYSSIEARVISWLAGEEWALEAFWAGRDIYKETAERMGGLTRAQGKIAVLALGYNGGPGSLKAMATDRDTITVDGEDVKLARVPDEYLYDTFVYPWRDANARIVRLWKLLDMRFRTGGAVGEHLSFEKSNGNKDRLLRLPSGRVIAYRKAGVNKYKHVNPETGKETMRERLTFSSPARYPARDDTYGGRLAENATQAIARDVMAEAIVRLERAGYPVVAHVHDEIIVEGEHDVDEIKRIMTAVPDWAEGMPIDGEGFTCKRYRKG